MALLLGNILSLLDFFFLVSMCRSTPQKLKSRLKLNQNQPIFKTKSTTKIIDVVIKLPKRKLK